ncbi:MAG: FKBP-type peptidyl-prolyl cis-trans isomerase [Verrucomicrobia bacterium]|nr:FKBP-type peptidyl-prolyl cis-trans isomerase [Verrucomicrobiota bacterium]
MNSTREKVSYCIGLETGKNLKRQFSDMDQALLQKGFQDGVTDGNPQLSPEEIQSIMQALRQQIEQQQKMYLAKMTEQNRQEGEAFLEENKQKDGVKVLKSGLQYKVLHNGTGPKPSITDVVSVHYRGSFINGAIFDSSYERGKPQVFPVNRVIPGWSEALQHMQVGDRWQIVVPHYLAYGEAGFGNEIGPCTTLVFEMELLGIN